MSSQRLNAAEKDLEKFIKFLALKSSQVVVQSRLGEKVQTSCNPLATGNDWFNIVIQDHPDVIAETKRALALGPGDSILQRFPLCIEISLKTVEGDQMILEVWSLDLQPLPQQQQQKVEKTTDTAPKAGSNNTLNTATNDQQTLKATHAIYTRMGILLKSLISLTRATPAYKLSRRQCADSYSIYYRIYVDRPQVHNLGEGHKQVRIGQLNTIVGALSMCVAYRTKMTITPTTVQSRNAETNPIMLKSDHFRPADGTTQTQPINAAAMKKAFATGVGTAKVIDIEKPLRPGAFTDLGKLRQYTEDDYVLPETPPFEWLLRRTRNESGSYGGSIESLNRKCDSPTVTVVAAVAQQTNGHQQNNTNNKANMLSNNNNNNNHNNNNNNNNKNVIASYENDGNSMKSSPNAYGGTRFSQSPVRSLLIVPPANAPQPHDDENLLKELNFPFASPTSHVNDLAKFYRDCYHAPPLRGLSELQPVISACSTVAANTDCCPVVDDVSRQLEQFETSLEDYDNLVKQLGLSASSSTGSRSSGGLQMSN